MTTTTTFQVIYLGNLPDIDGTEGNWISENASDLVGLEFGDASSPLAESTATWSQVGGADNTYDMDNISDTDLFSINGGPDQTFDGVAVYHATITYMDGTTANITATVAQDVTGETYLTPEFSDNADHAALEHDMIKSISLDSVAENDLVGLIAARQDMQMVTCFSAGTRIRAAQGEVPVEHLRIGDLVRTFDRGLQPIRWIGCVTVSAQGARAPIRFEAGTLQNTRPLLVSPQHRLLVRGAKIELCHGTTEALVAAHHMLHSKGVTRRPGGSVTYYHILFDQHELIWAEGTPAESFYPSELSLSALPPAARQNLEAVLADLEMPSLNQGVYGPLVRSEIPPGIWPAICPLV